MSKFRFSLRSRNNLATVKPILADVIRRALELSDVDFAVTEGIRTAKRQKELYASGASQTMQSKHLTGDAVDLVAFVGSRVSWEMPYYFSIADAVKAACEERAVDIRWGGAWTVPNIRVWDYSMERAYNQYVSARRKQGRTPFIDGPHFELTGV
jgi:hypothetical protein